MTCACENKIDDVIEKHPEEKDALSNFIEEVLGDAKSKSSPLYARRRGHLITILHKAQELFGYLPESVQLFVANNLDIHLTDVYGVISFYSYFTDKPVGKYKINVCTGTACFVKGSDRVLSEFCSQLGLEEGETSQDLEFSLGGLRCVGACSLAPVVMVNDKVYGHVSTKMVKQILKDCK